MLETATYELWIEEVRSGNIQKKQKNVSSAIIGLINTAKRKDLIYQYRYTDIREKRQTVYSSDLKELREKVQHHTKYYDEFVVLLEMEGYKKYDKNTIYLPRQELPFLQNFLILYGFLHNEEAFYNVFTTFEDVSI